MRWSNDPDRGRRAVGRAVTDLLVLVDVNALTILVVDTDPAFTEKPLDPCSTPHAGYSPGRPAARPATTVLRPPSSR